jgi:Putative phage metallopeptidase
MGVAMDETRYADATEAEYAVLTEVRNTWFTDFSDIRFRILFDLKKKISGKKFVLARVYKTNDLIKHLTLSEQEAEGTDLIIFLDKVCWDAIPQSDHIRIMRHELRHVIRDVDKIFLVGHDIEDFVSEVLLNQDDVGWRQRVANLTATIYQQREEEEKEAKKQAKGGRKRRGTGVQKLL